MLRPCDICGETTDIETNEHGQIICLLCKDDTNKPCKHNRTGYCFDCVRERHNQEALDGKYDDLDKIGPPR